MVALLLAATFLRFVAWPSAPPGMRYDETTIDYEVNQIRAGERPIYLESSSREALYFYLLAIAEDTIAPHLFVQHWLSAAFGLIAVAAAYTLGRQMFNARVGLLAAAFSAGAFWALMYSRLGDRLIALPACASVTLIFFWRGFQQGRWRDFVMAGLLLGVTAYTYTASRLFPLVFITFMLYLFLFHRPQLRRHALHFVLALAIGLGIALPMIVQIVTIPGADRRAGEVAGPLTALQQGDAGPAISSAAMTAGMFIAQGDPETLYNIPGRPVFDILTGVVFYLGVLICLSRLRQSNYAFLLIWLVVGLLPSAFAWPAASNSHSILAQPAVFLIAAIGLEAVAARVQHFKLAPSALLAGLLIALVLIVHTLHSVNDYFNVWANLSDVRTEQAADVAATARFFGQQPAAQPLVFSSGDVTHWKPWTATVFRMVAPIGYTNARWFDARSSFIFPHGASDLTLITAKHDDAPAPLDGRLIEDLFPIVEPLPTASDAYSATHLVSSLNTRLITLTQASVVWPIGTVISSPASLPLDFGEHLELIGYEVRKPIVTPGKNIRLTTYWRAKDRGVEPLSFFVHVLDAQGNIAAQWDGYTYSPYYVQPGDIIAQVHFIPIPANFAEGAYRLQLGLYHVLNGERVPIIIDGQPVSDRIWLQTIDISRS